MPRFSPYYFWFRSEIWTLIEDCCSCGLAECPNWCREFVELQMDKMLDKVIKDVCGGVSSTIDRGGPEPCSPDPPRTTRDQ